MAELVPRIEPDHGRCADLPLVVAIRLPMGRKVIMSSAATEYESFQNESPADIESRRFTLIPLLFIVFFLLLNFQTISYQGLENEDLEATKISDSQIRYYHWF